MKCYVHRSADAVGVCRACGRGVCPDCAAEAGNAVACRQRCEDDVRQVTEALRKQIQMMRPMGQTFANTAMAYRVVRRLLLTIGALVGLLGAGLAAWEATRFRPHMIEVVLEIGMAVIGVLVVTVGSKLPVPAAPPPSAPVQRAE